MVNSLNGRNKSLKQEIIQILGQEWPLETKKIYNIVKRNRNLSYQAVHKALKELVDERKIEKKEKTYQLRWEWIQSRYNEFQNIKLAYELHIKTGDFLKLVARYKRCLNKKLEPKLRKCINLKAKRMNINPQGFSLDNNLEEIILNVAEKENFLLLGEAGSGKTTSLLQVFYKFAKNKEKIPIYTNLSQCTSLEIKDIIKSELSEFSETDIDYDIIDLILKKGSFILLLDGLNEIPEEKKEIISNKINDFLANKDYKNTIVIAASRPFSMPENINLPCWEIKALDDKSLKSIISKNSDSKKDYYKIIKSEVLKSICKNPLLVKIVLDYIKENDKVIPNFVELYRNFVDNLIFEWLSKNFKPGTKLLITQKIHNALSSLAYEMNEKGTYLKKGEVKPFLSEEFSEYPELLNEIFDCSLLVLEENDCRFLHHSFQEYFASIKLYESLIANEKINKKLIKNLAGDELWQGTFIFASNHFKEASKFVKETAKTNVYLAARCLVSAKVDGCTFEYIVRKMLMRYYEKDTWKRWEGITILKTLGSKGVDILIDILKENESSKDSFIRGRLVWSLGYFKNRRSEDYLINRLLSEKMKHPLYHVLKGLQELKSKKATDALSKFLSNNDPIVRVEAAEAIERVEKRSNKRLQAIKKSALKELIELSDSEDDTLRHHAVIAMISVGDKRAVPYLIKALSDKHIDVRFYAILGLGILGDKETVKKLIELKKKQPQLSESIARVISAIQLRPKKSLDLIK